MPPLGAVPVKSTDCVAKTITPLCDTVNTVRPLAFLIKKMSLAALVSPNEPVTDNEPDNSSDPDIMGANNFINL